MFWTKQEILNLHEHHGPQPLFGLVLVAHLFIFLCCVFSLFVFLLCLVLNVASVSVVAVIVW